MAWTNRDQHSTVIANVIPTEQFQPQERGILVYGVNELGNPQPRLHMAAVRVSPSMNSQGLANTVWALATLRWQPGELEMRPALARAAVRVAPSMKAQEVANTLWALATLCWQAGEAAMRSALEGAAMRVAPSMKAQHIANTLWALATLGWKPSAALSMCLKDLVVPLFADGRGSRLPVPHLSQLLQAHLATQILGLELITLPPPILELALEAYRKEAQKVSVSSAQREVGASLHRLGMAYQLEYLTADGLFSIDAAIVDRRIAVEYDGPSHFTRNTLEPLGHTRLRDQLLSAIGWHVVSIPFFEWERLHGTAKQDAYVDRRVQALY
jgi:very-short-patch-repair endonuclease